MALKLTLAAKYAEQKKQVTSLSPKSLFYKSSAPSRTRVRTLESTRPYSYRSPAKPILEDIYKRHNDTLQEDLSLFSSRRDTSRMPGAFLSPIPSLRWSRRDTSRYRPLDINYAAKNAYKVSKRPELADSKNDGRNKSILSGLWALAKRIGNTSYSSPSEISELGRSAQAASNTVSSTVDVDDLLKLRNRDKVPALHNDLVEDGILHAKERQREKKEQDDLKKVIDALNEEIKNSDELKVSFEKQSRQMRQEFREELKQATRSIQDLTRRVETQNAQSNKTDFEEVEQRLFKENERFLTLKYEAEARLEALQKSLSEKETNIARLEAEFKTKQLNVNSFTFKIKGLLRLSLEMIKSDYDHERSVLATELASVKTAQNINKGHGKNILKILQTYQKDKDVKALFVLGTLLSLSDILTKDHMGTFVAASQDKLQRCQEYVADFDLEYLKDAKRVGDIYSVGSLRKIEECFEKIKKNVQSKLARSKLNEKENFEILASSKKTDRELENKLAAYFANNHLHANRAQLLDLLRGINVSLRSLKILKVKIDSKA